MTLEVGNNIYRPSAITEIHATGHGPYWDGTYAVTLANGETLTLTTINTPENSAAAHGGHEPVIIIMDDNSPVIAND